MTDARYTPIPGDESQADKLARYLKNPDEKSISSDSKQLDQLLSAIQNNRRNFNSYHMYYFEHREKFLDPEYNNIVKAAKTYGATLIQIKNALNVENGMDHDQIKRLINDAEQTHPNIERLRKEFYFEKIKQETNKIVLRERNPQPMAQLMDKHVLNAVNVGASLHELCLALRTYHKTTAAQADYVPIDRLVANKAHDSNPRVTRIKMEIKETEIVTATDKLLNLPKSSTKLFDDSRKKIEEELLEHCKQFTEMSGNVIETLKKHRLELPARTLEKFTQNLVPQANILNL